MRELKNEIYHVISNTHWDREWYQSHEKYLVRLVELMDRLLDIMEAQPDYRFVTDGQYALVEDYLAVKPENTGRVKKLVSEGRLLIGPWYTQPLENIVGGEALVRNLQKGIDESEKLGGVMRFSYEIDEFGHTSQLPQILAGFGISGVMTCRGIPDYCRSFFKWESPDGTQADMFRSNVGYGEATDLPTREEDFVEMIDGAGVRRDGLVSKVNKNRELRLKVSDSKNMLWLNGIDHSWAQEDIFEICRRIEELFPEIEVKQSTPEEYAEAVLNDLKEKGIVPEVFRGELMFTSMPVLEPTNALHPRQKRRHYESEKLLVSRVEPFAELASLLGCKYPRWAVEREWKYVLENHAHDSLGCCSVDEVFEQVMARYGASISIGEQICSDSLRYIMSCGSSEPSLWIFNTCEKDMGGSLRVSFDVPVGFGGENIYLETPQGEKVAMSVISVRTNGDVRYNPRRGHPVWGEVAHFEAIIDAPAVPAFGAVRLAIKEKAPFLHMRNRQDCYFASEPGVLENKYLSVRVAPNGTFTLTDKRSGRIYPSQLLFTDDGEAGHCYIHVEPQNDMRRYSSLGCAADICTLYDTPLGAACRVDITMNIPVGITADRKARTEETGELKISSVISLEKDSETVGIEIHIDNKCRNHRVRALFPTYFENAAVSESGQAFDEVERPIAAPEIAEIYENLYTTHPMQEHCSVSENGAGLAVAARGIYEYECTDNNSKALAITLLRAIEVIDNETFEKTPEYFMEEAQNLCGINQSLTLIPFDGNRENMLHQVSAALSKPFALVNRATEDSLMPDYKRPENVIGDMMKVIELTGEGLAVTTFKRAAKSESLIVRIRNRGSSAVDGCLKLNIPGVKFGDVYYTDLEENRTVKAGCGNEIAVSVPCAKLLTLEFEIIG